MAAPRTTHSDLLRPAYAPSTYCAGLYPIVVVTMAVGAAVLVARGLHIGLAQVVDGVQVAPTHGKGWISDNAGVGSIPQRESGCNIENGDMYRGHWVPKRPNSTYYLPEDCPLVKNNFACRAHGRADRSYEDWEWQPVDPGCRLGFPGDDARHFLEAMRGKRLLIGGDSLGRNLFGSLGCMLWKAEQPYWEGDELQVLYWERANFTLVYRQSYYLVRTARQAPPPDALRVEPAEEGGGEGAGGEGAAELPTVALHQFIDEADPVLLEQAAEADVVLLSTGHWWEKADPAVVVEKGKARGVFNWPRPVELPVLKLEDTVQDALAAVLVQVAGAMAPKERRGGGGGGGTLILRTYSPMHFKGDWKDGVCDADVQPLVPAEEQDVRDSWLVQTIWGAQLAAFQSVTNGTSTIATRSDAQSDLRVRALLMDIAPMAMSRADGHPAKNWEGYNKSHTQDCLHWCLPGVIDTWSIFLLEIMYQIGSGTNNH